MYEIFEQKSGRKVGIISEGGQICCFEKSDQKKLEIFLRREILVREGEETTIEGEVEDVLEETMCFFGITTLRLGEAGHLETTLRQLPLLTEYKATKQLIS